MSKVAEYLAEHMLGEASARPGVLAKYMRDGSVLEKRPEMVLFPRSTSDLRKITTFSWRLAEKGHVLPLIARGAGLDSSGASIGRGAIIDLAAHMNRIFEYEPKQRLVRVQPGARLGAIQSALSLNGGAVAHFLDQDQAATAGGMIASGMAGPRRFRYGELSNSVAQLEIVLANGDVIQTGPLSKRELSRKKSQQDMEGEIYRKLDNLIEENQTLFSDNDANVDRAGYGGIFAVKTKKQFDLTPLFIGSSGTLGVISEMIFNAVPAADGESVVVLLFSDKADARDAAAKLRGLEPSYAEYYDGELFTAAKASGKKYEFIDDAPFSAAIVVGFGDVAEKARAKKVKKLQKAFAKETGVRVLTISEERAHHLLALRDVRSSGFMMNAGDVSWPPMFDNFYVPEERVEEFITNLSTLMSKYRFDLPMQGDILSNIYSIRPGLYMRRVADKQKIFKLIDELAAVVSRVDGALIGDGSEGRLQANFAYKQLDPTVRDLYAAIKTIFDPHGILNPGVKEPSDLGDLVAMLRNDY